MLNSLRLRTAYGASGVQPGPTASLALYAPLASLIDGAATSGIELSALGNPELKPERQRELEVGFDADAINSRVRLEATYYSRRSTDALFNRPLPSSIGTIATRQENLGSVSNSGTEATLSARMIDASYLSWDATLNGSLNTNRIEKLATGIDNPSLGLVVGYPLFGRFARPITGYNDANGNGIIETNEVTVGASDAYIGSPLPRKQLTASTTVGFLPSHLRISTVFDYRGDWQVNNFIESNSCGGGFCQAVNDPKTPLERQAFWVARSSPAFGSTIWGFYEDGTFTKWRELSVTYDLPGRWLRYSRASNASVTIAGRNLAKWTQYRGTDPEVNLLPPGSVGGGSEYNNDNFGTPPAARYWIVRINASF